VLIERLAASAALESIEYRLRFWVTGGFLQSQGSKRQWYRSLFDLMVSTAYVLVRI